MTTQFFLEDDEHAWVAATLVQDEGASEPKRFTLEKPDGSKVGSWLTGVERGRKELYGWLE